jgi:BRCT domain type II-containing protein
MLTMIISHPFKMQVDQVIDVKVLSSHTKSMVGGAKNSNALSSSFFPYQKRKLI